MSNFILDKKTITGKILDIINPDWDESTLSAAFNRWWVNRRTSGGLGLSLAGVEAFNLAEIAHWEHELTPREYSTSTPPTAKEILLLDRYIKCPYYFGHKGKIGPIIKIYDGRISGLIYLHGGIKEYIQSLGKLK
jgi:hypothetical protein